MQANYSWHKLIHFHLSFLSKKYGKEGKKIQKSEYLENETNFFDEIKIIFYSF